MNGTAGISVDPSLLGRFCVGEKLPRSVIIVNVETVYFQCPRAAVRADLWNPEKFLKRSALPSNGQMLSDLSGEREYLDRDETRDETVRKTLY